jgi:hypothetical protein
LPNAREQGDRLQEEEQMAKERKRPLDSKMEELPKHPSEGIRSDTGGAEWRKVDPSTGTEWKKLEKGTGWKRVPKPADKKK